MYVPTFPVLQVPTSSIDLFSSLPPSMTLKFVCMCCLHVVDKVAIYFIKHIQQHYNNYLLHSSSYRPKRKMNQMMKLSNSREIDNSARSVRVVQSSYVV